MNQSNNVVIAHSGRQHSYYVAKNLQSLGRLKGFYTSAYISNLSVQNFIIRNKLNFFSKRFLYDFSGPLIHTYWSLELRELLARFINKNAEEITKCVCRRDQDFDTYLASKLRSIKYDTFWGYQGSCLKSLMVANSMNRNSIVEMTMPYVPFSNKILIEESVLHPEWKDSINIISYPGSYEKRLVEEPVFAKKVVAVSSFLKKTLTDNGIEESKISVLPLGFDVSRISFSMVSSPITDRPLKLLFVGRITQVKGIKYMLDAMEKLNTNCVELHFIGSIIGSGKEFLRRKHLYTYHGSMSQRELYPIYKDFDVLLLPSLVEGFPLVIIEAMGGGLPIITTNNTSAEELIIEGETGYIVPIRDSEAIVLAVQKVLALSSDEFANMRQKARQKALNYTWQSHKERLKIFLNGL